MNPNRSISVSLLAGLAATAVVTVAAIGSYLSGSLGKADTDVLSYPPSVVRVSIKPPDNPEVEKPPGFLPPESVSVPTLIYHNVAAHKAAENRMQQLFTVAPDVFRRQMQYLVDNGYHTVLPAQIIDVLEGRAELPDKPVMLAFDDGWRGQYDHAYPVLNELDLKGIFYVFTNPVTHGDKRYLSWEMLTEMIDHGMAVGSHTVTHPYLKKETDEGLADQLARSKMALEENLGRQITDFAYPFGQVDERITAAVAKAGYLTGRTLAHRTLIKKDTLLNLGGYIVTDNFGDFTRIFEVK